MSAARTERGRFMRKRNACTGETLVETLCSLLIMSMGALMLSGAVISAARVNDRAARMLGSAQTEPRPMEFDGPDLSGDSASYVRIRGADGEFTIEINVTEYNGDFFYEKAR